jgi:hypothetical protein
LFNVAVIVAGAAAFEPQTTLLFLNWSVNLQLYLNYLELRLKRLLSAKQISASLHISAIKYKENKINQSRDSVIVDSELL